MEKHFQLEGLDYYVTAPDVNTAVVFCHLNHWGVMAENLVQVDKVPATAARHINYYDEYVNVPDF